MEELTTFPAISRSPKGKYNPWKKENAPKSLGNSEISERKSAKVRDCCYWEVMQWRQRARVQRLVKKRFYFSLEEFCKCLHLLGVSKYVTPAVNAKLKYEKYAELNLFKLLCSINGNKCIDNVKRTLTELNESWNTVDGKRDIYTIHLTKEEVEQRELFMNQRHSRILQRGSSRRRKLNKVNLHKSTTRIVQWGSSHTSSIPETERLKSERKARRGNQNGTRKDSKFERANWNKTIFESLSNLQKDAVETLRNWVWFVSHFWVKNDCSSSLTITTTCYLVVES